MNLRHPEGIRVLISRQWGSGDSNPDALRHQILSLARLPIPALPQEYNMILNHVVFHLTACLECLSNQSLPELVLKCQPRHAQALEQCSSYPHQSLRYYTDVTTGVYKRLGR